MRTIQILLCFSLTLLFVATSTAKIVFNVSDHINSSIYVMDDVGGNIKRITDNTNSDWKPRWSPNGRQIAFARDTTPNDGSVKPYVYIMNTDGTSARQISNYTGYILDLAFSPDGKKIIYNTTLLGIRLIDLNMIDLDNIQPQVLTGTHIYHLDWSPDGKQIVYVNDDHGVIEKNLWLVDADGENSITWTEPDPEKGTMNRLHPKWSPDGKKLLYTESDTIVKIKELEDGRRSISTQYAGSFRYIIQNIDDRAIQILNIPDNFAPISVDWMDGQKYVLFCAYDFDEYKITHQTHPKIYKYDIASEEVTFLADGSNADWHGGAMSVSPVGKHTLRWGELKESYID